MNEILRTLLPLVEKLVRSSAGGSGTVAAVIDNLVESVPLLIREYQDLTPFVKNIIAAVREDPAATAAQIDQLDVLDAKVDAAFDAAAQAAEAEDRGITR